jgi:hypothetical protein
MAASAGFEVTQVGVDFESEVVSPRHPHPGEEIVYVHDDSPEYQSMASPRRGRSRPVTGLFPATQKGGHHDPDQCPTETQRTGSR